jgi:heptosyltransferase-2
MSPAFPGDIVLALPLLQALRAQQEVSSVAMVVTPSAAGLLENHPSVDEVIVYDKRGTDRGISGVLRLSRRLRARQYDVALVPHRSLRSAVAAFLAGISRRVGFTTSAGRWLLTDRVQYNRHDHEVQRNLRLLGPLGIRPAELDTPALYPDGEDREVVERLLRGHQSRYPRFDSERLVALAPGSVWATKRWPQERYEELGRSLVADGASVALIGGSEDRGLCEAIVEAVSQEAVLNAAGYLSLLQSAELIRRCRVAVSNDSAPMHLAVAVRTPVIAIFGPTVPEFGFAPHGANDIVLGVPHLACRPCSIHGGASCPIKSFDCMVDISAETVRNHIHYLLNGTTNSHHT